MAINLITPEYGYVLLAVSALAFECLLIGFLVVGRIRKDIFNQRFMKENFGEIHNQEIKEQIKAGGLPDTGNGNYSRLLSYSEWYNFNNAQRAHLNFVEQIGTTLALIAVGGLYNPIIQASFGLLMILARILYTVGYLKNGPTGRTVGAVMWDIGLFSSMALACISAIKLILGHSP